MLQDHNHISQNESWDALDFHLPLGWKHSGLPAYFWWMFRAVFPNINGWMDLRKTSPKFPSHSGPWVVLQGHVWTHSIHAPVGRSEMLQKFTNTASIYIKHKHYIIYTYWKRWFSKMLQSWTMHCWTIVCVIMCRFLPFPGAVTIKLQLAGMELGSWHVQGVPLIVRYCQCLVHITTCKPSSSILLNLPPPRSRALRYIIQINSTDCQRCGERSSIIKFPDIDVTSFIIPLPSGEALRPPARQPR